VASRGTVWITRAQPGASATARRVETLGFTALIDPLLEIAALLPDIDLAGVEALAFTSANGVEAFAALCPARHLPVFTVGDSTARAARAAGFADSHSADGDVEALADLLARARPGDLLCPGAAEPAADLPALLAARGLSARSVAVYAARERAPSPETLALLPDLTAVLLHSPRAARALAEVLETSPATRLRALCLSPAVAAVFDGGVALGRVGAVAFASRPRETDLLDLLAP